MSRLRWFEVLAPVLVLVLLCVTWVTLNLDFSYASGGQYQRGGGEGVPLTDLPATGGNAVTDQYSPDGGPLPADPETETATIAKVPVHESLIIYVLRDFGRYIIFSLDPETGDLHDAIHSEAGDSDAAQYLP